MLGSARVEDHLENLILNVIGQHAVEYRLGHRLENITEQWLNIFLGRFLVFLRQIETADWQERLHDGALTDRIDEMGEEDGNLVDFAVKEFLRAKFRDRFGFDKRRRVFQLEIGQQLALGARDELPRFSPGDHKCRLGRVKVRRLSKKIRVQRSGQSVVGSDDPDELFFHIPDFKKRMQT